MGINYAISITFIAVLQTAFRQLIGNSKSQPAHSQHNASKKLS